MFESQKATELQVICVGDLKKSIFEVPPSEHAKARAFDETGLLSEQRFESLLPD